MKKSNRTVTIPDYVWEPIERIALKKYHENFSATVTEIIKDGLLVQTRQERVDREKFNEVLSYLLMPEPNIAIDVSDKLIEMSDSKLDNLSVMLQRFIFEIKRVKVSNKHTREMVEEYREKERKKTIDEAFG